VATVASLFGADGGDSLDDDRISARLRTAALKFPNAASVC
jgi:hypothetical protein